MKAERGSNGLAWRAATIVAFRFAFAFFGLYCLLSHLLVYLFVLPGILPAQGLGTKSPLFDLTSWVAVRAFGITEPLVYIGNSRDTNFSWVQLFVVFVIAAAATLVWSVMDRRRTEYVALHKWFRVLIRFVVAAQMIYFGMVKVIPTQFPAPSLITLLAPVGNLSLQGLQWTSIGASTTYQIFTGIVEVVGGLLLIAPRTTLLGAAVCLASMLQVFVLNMTYDIGVKILSFQLVLMSLFLLAPDIQVLVNVFFFKRPVAPTTEPELFRTPRANRIALVVQIVYGLYLLAVYTNVGRTFWYADGGGGSPKSSLYGIWNIEALTVDGKLRPAELNDYDRRWRRVIFDSPEWLYFQRTDDSFMRYGVSIDLRENRLALKKGHSPTWRSDFTIQRPEADALLLDGHMDGHTIKMSLRAVGWDTFRLLNSRFRWVRPPDREE
jgi:hypothetical protein